MNKLSIHKNINKWLFILINNSEENPQSIQRFSDGDMNDRNIIYIDKFIPREPAKYYMTRKYD